MNLSAGAPLMGKLELVVHRFVLPLVLALAACIPRLVCACDSYDGKYLTISIVAVGTTTYTNVVITVPSVVSVGGETAGASSSPLADVYDQNTGRLTISCVTVGGTTYTNVVATVGSVISIGGAYPREDVPVITVFSPLPDAVVGKAYSQKVAAPVYPDSQYTFGIDTLAVGNGTPPGMTLDMNGILSGTPFATGGTDINGKQVPHAYTFGICATDTLTRLTTHPCPTASVTVDPPTCDNGATDYPTCTLPVCSNGATDYPTCTPSQAALPTTAQCSAFKATVAGLLGQGADMTAYLNSLIGLVQTAIATADSAAAACACGVSSAAVDAAGNAAITALRAAIGAYGNQRLSTICP
jgi:hypothetical protein